MMTSDNVSRRLFLGGSAAAAVVAASAATATAARASTMSARASDGGTLKAGAGKSVISIPASILPTWDGFTALNDDLYVRVLLVDNGETSVAFAVYDMTGIDDPTFVPVLQDAINEITGVPTDNVIVSVTHSFSAPHIFQLSQETGTDLANLETYRANTLAATKAAATSAYNSLQPARVGYGRGKSDVNVNRNVDTIDGWWLGTGEAGPSDKSVRVTRFDDLDGNPFAIICNYSVQSAVMISSVMDDGALPITSDLAGWAVDHVEGQYDGVTGFFLCGATGDQFPTFMSNRYVIDKDKNWSMVDAHDGGWLLLTVQAERLGTEVVRVAQTIETTADPTIRLVTGSVTATEVTQGHPADPVTSYTWTPDGTIDMPVWVLQIGDGVFIGVEPELSTETSLDIMAASPLPHANIISNLAGGAKNMADIWNYDHITYESVDSFLAKGTAEMVAHKAAQLLRTLR
jgi:neutral ceramidase